MLDIQFIDVQSWLISNSTDRDHRWLEWFEQKFSSLPDEIDFEQFKKALHIKEVSTHKNKLKVMP